MFSPATRRRDATRLPVALQGGLSVSPGCLWVRAGCARRRSGYRHWHIGWTFQYRFVCVGIRLRPVFSQEGRTAAEVRRLNLERMEKRRVIRQGFSSGKYMTTRHRMEHDIGRREARFVRHILFEAIRAIDALQAARTVLQREFCLWTQAESAARNHFNAYLRIAGELCGLLAVRRG